MNKVLQIKSKIDELESEFFNFTALYNLHIVQVKNAFNHAILKAYAPTLKEEYNIATTYSSNQNLFYFTPTKQSKTINLSTEMFQKIWKIFLKEIEILSIANSSKEFYNSFAEKEFVNVVIKRTSSANIYFKIKGKASIHSQKLEFSYKPRTLQEREFLLKNKDIWLHISSSLESKLLKNKDVIAKLKKPMVLKINPFSGSFAYRITQSLTDKIKERSLGKIDIKIVNVNENKKVVTLKLEMFIPLEFIDYMKEYIRSNTLYEVHFAKIKQV
jgi:hypothetical protein